MYKIGTMLPVLARTHGKKKEQKLAFLSLLAYIQKALCRHRRKNDRKGHFYCSRSRRDWVRYLLSPILCVIKRCFHKEEFDTDRSQGFLKRFNRILCTVIFKTQGVCVREQWPFKYYITGNMHRYERSFFTFSIH